MSCKKCAAPLEGYAKVCRYCGTYNTTDLNNVHKFTTTEPEPGRHCPRCDIPLSTIDMDIGERFLVERCDKCLGLFFDPNELCTFIECSVSNVHEVNYLHLQEFLREREGQELPPVNYIKCPECRAHMNRENYGARSGVIVDRCREHGVWLDGGELTVILDWVKAGGKIHEENRQQERARLIEHRKKLEELEKKVDRSVLMNRISFIGY